MMKHKWKKRSGEAQIMVATTVIEVGVNEIGRAHV